MKNKGKKVLYFLFRIVYSVVDPFKFYFGLTGYFWYIRDIFIFNKKSKTEKIKLDLNIFPVLNEKTNYTPFDSAYYYQQLWAFEKILKNNPKEHVDIASTYQFSGYVSKITKTVFIDYRPIKTKLKNLEIIQADILNLPFTDNSKLSVSCLHVIEHIGLGRYGDNIDPEGYKKAINELQRVVAPLGKLYISTPVGVSRLYFNAHRIFDPEYIIKLFDKCKLVEFSLVNDNGDFLENVDISMAKNKDYACGMYVFEKL